MALEPGQAPQHLGSPGDYPIAWCSEYGSGKVFYTSLATARTSGRAIIIKNTSWVESTGL